LKLTDALDFFTLSLEAAGRSPQTIRSYSGRLLVFAESCGAVDLEEITPIHIDRWMVKLRRQERKYSNHPTRPEAEGKLSPYTISGRIQAVKRFLRWCVDRGYLDQSPAAHLRRGKPKGSASKRVMSRRDFDKMVTFAGSLVAEKGNWRDLALLLFVADTGARAGETAGLRIPDLDLLKREAVINGKTGEGVVDFTHTTAQVLRFWLDSRPVPIDEPDSRHVFVVLYGATQGRPLLPGGIYQIFRRLGLAAGVEGRYNPHSLRHLVGQRYTDKGNLELARQKLRHRDIKVTADFYSHQDRGRIKAATQRLSLAERLGVIVAPGE